MADVFDGGETEEDAVSGGGEICGGDLDVGGNDGDAELAALADVLDDIFGLGGFGGEESGHELDGVVGLEPGGVIGEEGVGGGVGFVEAIACELLHEVEELTGALFVELAGGGSGHEDVALLGHLGGIFFTHGTAQEVGATEGVTADGGADLHDLLLIDDDAEGFAEDGFELVEHKLDGAAAPFAFDEVVDHAALDGAGTIEGVEGGEVFDGGGLVAAKDVAHAAGLELEDAGGEGAVEDFFVGFEVVKGDGGEIDFGVAVGTDELEAVINDGQGGEAEKVHLEKAHLLDGFHVVAGDDSVVFCAGYGDQLGQWLRCDDDAGGVDPGASDEAFEAESGVDKLSDLGVFVGEGERRRVFEGLLDGDADGGGDEFGDAIDFTVGHVEGAANVFDGGFGGHGVEGDDLRDLVGAVLAADILDDFDATVHAEVDVDIGHGDAFGVEEALEEEVVLEGIDVGDAHHVGDERTGGGTATGADGNSLLAGVLDEVPHNHEIAGKLHLLDAVYFAIEAGFVVGDGLAELAGVFEVLDGGFAAGTPAVAADLLEVGVEVHAVGAIELGEGIFDFGEFEVAALRELHGAGADFGSVGEEAVHLFGGLDVELLGIELEALGIVHGPGGLDAEEDFVGAGVLVFDVVGVVGGDQRDVEVAFEAEHGFGDGFVGGEAVVLDFEEEVAAAEHGFEVAGGLFGEVVVPFHEVLGDLAGEAAGEADQAFGVFGEEGLGDAGLFVEAVEGGLGGEADKVAVAGFVFGEDEEVIVLGVRVGVLAEVGVFLADVELAAEDGLERLFVHGVEEVDGAVDVAVVGDGGGGLADLGEVLGELVDVAGTVEERVVGVEMEVGELCGHEGSLLPGYGWQR